MSQCKPEERLTMELSCPICLQLYRNPVALPCGHNYCLGCIENVVDAEGPKNPKRCPECREEYGSPETLRKNFKLSGIVDGYLSVTSAGGLRGSAPKLCDQCLDDPMVAVKFCTHCEMSLCSGHLKRHEERHRDHGLVELLAERDGKRCPVHGKTTEYLCSQERLFICSDCVMEGTHQNHDVQTFEVAKVEMKRVLEGLGKTVFDKLQMTKALLKNAISREESVNMLENKLVARANILLDNMLTLISGYKSRMSTLMDDELQLHDKSWQSNLSDLEGCQQLLEEAYQSTNEVLSEPSEFLFIQHYLNFEARVRQAANVTIPIPIPAAQDPSNAKYLRSNLRTDNFHTQMSHILDCLCSMMNPLDLTFNPSTAHPGLLLSTDLKTVKQCAGRKSTSAGDHSERFYTAAQVMCSQGFSAGVHMWMVEMGPGCMWSVGLCYKSIPRKGDHSKLGHNSSSWRLQWKNKKLTVCHDSVNVAVGDGLIVPPKRVEVTLDYEGGTIAFHSTGHGGRKQHLYTCSALFKDVVYPAFGIHSTSGESWITLLTGA